MEALRTALGDTGGSWANESWSFDHVSVTQLWIPFGECSGGAEAEMAPLCSFWRTITICENCAAFVVVDGHSRG
jgi:hypothetical protein